MILLIQFRTDQSGWHEIKSVYEAGGVPHHYYSVISATNKTVDVNDIVSLAKQSELVLLGGAGECGYEADSDQAQESFQTAKEKMSAAIPRLLEANIPMIGMCFGHQLLADTLGGSVAQDKSQAEAGVTEICLTDAGKEDKLLTDLDDCFPAVVGHKVSVTELPEDATLLAQSEKCPIQAFRYQDNVYGFQFHPELNKDTLQDRLDMYPEYKEYKVKSTASKPVTADKITKRAIKVFTQ